MQRTRLRWVLGIVVPAALLLGPRPARADAGDVDAAFQALVQQVDEGLEGLAPGEPVPGPVSETWYAYHRTLEDPALIEALRSGLEEMQGRLADQDPLTPEGAQSVAKALAVAVRLHRAGLLRGGSAAREGIESLLGALVQHVQAMLLRLPERLKYMRRVRAIVRAFEAGAEGLERARPRGYARVFRRLTSAYFRALELPLSPVPEPLPELPPAPPPPRPAPPPPVILVSATALTGTWSGNYNTLQELTGDHLHDGSFFDIFNIHICDLVKTGTLTLNLVGTESGQVTGSGSLSDVQRYDMADCRVLGTVTKSGTVRGTMQIDPATGGAVFVGGISYYDYTEGGSYYESDPFDFDNDGDYGRTYRGGQKIYKSLSFRARIEGGRLLGHWTLYHVDDYGRVTTYDEQGFSAYDAEGRSLFGDSGFILTRR